MRGTFPLLALTIFARFSDPLAAAAQTVVPIPETVVTATRNPLPVTDIPAGVTVIDRQAIDASGAVTMGEILATVPGLHAAPTGGPGSQTSVFMRGTNSAHVLVLRDGMPINDASAPQGAYDFGSETLSDIERIEIVRGPMAALYGSGAIGGVINLISRRGTTATPRVEMDLSGGYPAAIVGAASVSGIAGPFDYALTIEGQGRRGFDATPQRMSTYTNTPQGFSDRIATANLGYSPVEGTRFSLFLRGAETFFGLNEGPGTIDDANSTGTTGSLLGRIGMTSRPFNGAYETGVFLGRSQDDRHYLETLNPADPNLSTRDDRYHMGRTDLRWNNTIHLNDLVPSTMLTASDFTFGAEQTTDSIIGRANDSSIFGPYMQSERASETKDALYAGLTATVSKRVILSGQVRQDWASGNTPTTWRLGVIYKVPEIWTAFKIAYGTAFRTPSLYERFGIDSYGTVGNPALKPESSEGWEIGITTAVPVFGREDGVTTGIAYYNQRIANLIENVILPAGTYTWENVSAAHIQGAETEITVRPGTWMSLHASWSFIGTTSDDPYLPPGAALERRPKNTLEVDATITPMPGLRIVPVLIYTGPSFDIIYDNSGNYLGYGVGQHGLVANMTVAYDLTPNAILHLDGTNLFESRFEPVNGYQMPGTSVIAGIRVRW